MNNSKDFIILNLPYPARFLGVNFLKPRRIGFLFTNLSIFLFRENEGLLTSDDYNAWVKERGQAQLVSEMVYAAAQAYCMEEKVKENFTHDLLRIAIATSCEADQKRIVEAWKHSQTFGAKIEKKKVKVTLIE
jgi:hypothetical protein